MKIITVKDVYHFLCQWAPLSLAEDWDPVGLQVGSLKNEVKGILVALDVTQAVLEETKKKKCNLLITHHPLMGRLQGLAWHHPPHRAGGAGRVDFPRFDPHSIPARLAKKAKQQKINILSFHTNLDSTEEGLNDLLAQQLKLKNLKPLMKSRNKEFPKAGIGRIGSMAPIPLKQFLKHVSRCTKLKHFRYVGDLNRKIKKVAVVTGSGAGYFLQAKKKGADVLVTGDVKYHTALDALAEGIILIDIGHFAGEIGMVDLVLNKLKNGLPLSHKRISIYPTRAQVDPFDFWA